MRQSYRVVLLVPTAREFERGIRRGVVEYAHAHGPWMLLEEAPDYLQALTSRQRLRDIGGWQADGMIVLRRRFSEVRSLRIPVIVVGAQEPLVCRYQLLCADEEIGRLGAATLIELGMRHFAYCGLHGLPFSSLRGAAFRQAVEQAGYPAYVYPALVPGPGHSWYAEQKLLARWLSTVPKPAGLMACNDDRARMLAEVCRLQGIHVPDEVAILGVDNDEQVCRSATPPLSSIALATERAGYDAAALLASLMAGQTPAADSVTVFPTRVVPRQSTGILAVEDVHVVRALRFIRENSTRNLRVSDLVSVAGLSRRALQDAFVKHLGRTPIEEIQIRRVERIAQMLIETNMSIGTIAEAAGFEVSAHLARFFARHTGMTPLAYRKKYRNS